MNSKQGVREAVRYALAAGAAAALASPAIHAADADQSASADQSSTAQLGKIEVTGTRIKRTTVETAQPVTIVTSAQIKQSGFSSVGDVLQNLTSAGFALNSQVNNGNNGQEDVDLRHLGEQRVLVLVNGRRWVTQLNNVVDFFTIPSAIIDHIEILQDGASAIYGSDAIAGVINVITTKNYNGAEANAYMGVYKGDGHTDGKKQIYDFTLGSSGDRSAALMSVSYANEQPVWAGNREMSKESIWGLGGGSSAIPAGRFVLNGTACTNAKAAGAAISITSSGSCDIKNDAPGTLPKPDLKQFGGFLFSRDSFNYAPLNYLVAPTERTSFYSQAHFDIADNLTFTTELLFNDRSSQQSLAPAPLFLGLVNQGTTNGGVNIGIAKDNPYNPFGVDLVPYFPSDPNFAAWCAAYGSSTCAATGSPAVVIRRRPLEAGNRLFNQNVDTYHWAGGLKGYFNLLGKEWDWDVNTAYSRNYQNTVTDGQFNTARLQEALSEKCGTAADPSCVPLNLFGGAVQGGAGTITPAQAAYVGFEEHDIFVVNERDYTANIGGDLFDLPAGPVGLALGYEYLETDALFHPDALKTLGNTTDNITTPTNGRVATDAEYFEFNIPLVSDAPFMKDVSLDLANRFSQFKWGGVGPNQVFVPGATHNSSGRAALRWQANDDLLLRASWSQGFRVPSVAEFYAGASNNFPAISDPCTTNATVKGPFCAANGHPIVAKQANGQIQSIGGGNASLTPEKSISRTLGFVYNPDWLPGFDTSMDYYKVDVVNTVGTIGQQNIVNGCYINDVKPYCSLLQIAGGQINAIINTNKNVGTMSTDGVDVSAHYRFASTASGDFKLGLDLTFLRSLNLQVPNANSPSGFATSRLAGWVGIGAGTSGVPGSFPKRRATVSLDWHYGDWSAMYTLFYVDHTIEACTNANVSPTTAVAVCTFQGGHIGPGGSFIQNTNGVNTWNPQGFDTLPGHNHVGATTYSDVQGTYHMQDWNTDFTFGIQNLWDKRPPFSISAFANSYNPSYNRVPGRFFYGRVGVKF